MAQKKYVDELYCFKLLIRIGIILCKYIVWLQRADDDLQQTSLFSSTAILFHMFFYKIFALKWIKLLENWTLSVEISLNENIKFFVFVVIILLLV